MGKRDRTGVPRPRSRPAQGRVRNGRPETIYTLGNAALRVLRELVDVTDAPKNLTVDGYGAMLDVRLAGGHACRWVPLAHPAAPKAYQEAHSLLLCSR